MTHNIQRLVHQTLPNPVQDIGVDAAGRLENIVNTAAGSFARWSSLTTTQRCDLLRRAAGLLQAQREKFESLLVARSDAESESAHSQVSNCIAILELCFNHSSLLDSSVTTAEAPVTAGNPTGIALGIEPWMASFSQLMRFVVANLVAGNVVITSHDPSSIALAMALAALCTEAGIAPGVMTVCALPQAQVATLISDARITSVTVTDSWANGGLVLYADHVQRTLCGIPVNTSHTRMILREKNLAPAVFEALFHRMHLGMPKRVPAPAQFGLWQRMVRVYERTVCYMIAPTTE